VYWDAGLTIPAPLPIRTQGGYPVNSGTPARLYVGSDYSIQVQDKNGSVAYTSLNNNGPLAGGSISSVNVTFLQAGSGAVERTAQSKMRETVSVKDFGALGDGIANDTVAIQAAIATGKNVYLPTGTYKITSALELTEGMTLYGDGIEKSILLAADGITAIRVKVSFVTIADIKVQCDRPATGTWVSVNAKGIYVKDGPDDVNSDPTAYIQYFYMRNVWVARFYESVEVNGAFAVDFKEVTTIQDNFGYTFNRSFASLFAFVGTTLSLHKCFARGNNNNFTSNVGSVGLRIFNYTNMSVIGCVSERYEQSAIFRGIQSGNIDDFYCEKTKFGLFFHTLTGMVYLRSVYYNNVGEQFATGGYTLRVLAGTLVYSPGRFTFTDNSAQIDATGELLAIGRNVTTLTGAAASSYAEVSFSNIEMETLKAKKALAIGSTTSRSSFGISGLVNVDRTFTAKITVGSPAQSDWRQLCLRLITVSGSNDASSFTTYQEKVLTFSFISSTNTINSIGDIDVSLPGAANVSLNAQAISAGEITITLNAVAKTTGATWTTQLIAEAMCTLNISPLTLTAI
jgi:hypothetical protein